MPVLADGTERRRNAFPVPREELVGMSASLEIGRPGTMPTPPPPRSALLAVACARRQPSREEREGKGREGKGREGSLTGPQKILRVARQGMAWPLGGGAQSLEGWSSSARPPALPCLALRMVHDAARS